MEIEVHNQSGTVKKIQAESRVVRDGKGHILASWMSAGDCYIDLENGDVIAEAMPLGGGFYEVDLDTGRLIGSAWRVPMPDLETIGSLSIGSKVLVEHSRSGDVDMVQLVDLELSRGVVRVMAKTGRATGRCFTTGWRVTSADLTRLRTFDVKRVA